MKFFPRLLWTFTPLILLPIGVLGGMALVQNHQNHEEIEKLSQTVRHLERQAEASSDAITHAFEEKTRANYD